MVLLLVLSACSVSHPNQNPSLFQQLGSMAGLRTIVDELAWQLATDEMIASSLLRNSDFMKLKQSLLFFLCAKTQGPCLYVGERPIVPFAGSPSGGAKRMLDLIYSSAQARGVSERLTQRFVHAVEDDIREMIGLPRTVPERSQKE